jgi:hypothetical protein
MQCWPELSGRGAGYGRNGTKSSNRSYPAMKPTPFISEKRAAIFIGIGAAVFTIGAMIFGH